MNKLLALILFSLGVLGTQGVLSYFDSQNNNVLQQDPISGKKKISTSAREELLRDEQTLKKVYRQVASERPQTKKQESESYKTSNEFLADFYRAAQNEIESLGQGEIISFLEERAKAKDVLFLVKKDLLIRPEKFNCSDEDVYKMLLKDLTYFPPQLALLPSMNNPSSFQDQLSLDEKMAQDEYLVLAYQKFLEHNAQDIDAIESQTALIMSRFKNTKDDDYSRMIMDMKNSFLNDSNL